MLLVAPIGALVSVSLFAAIWTSVGEASNLFFPPMVLVVIMGTIAGIVSLASVAIALATDLAIRRLKPVFRAAAVGVVAFLSSFGIACLMSYWDLSDIAGYAVVGVVVGSACSLTAAVPVRSGSHRS